jgi:O-antigen ligase
MSAVAGGATYTRRGITARVGLAGTILASIVLLVLAQSIFWAPHVPHTLKLGMAALLVLSAVRPGDGLLVVAALSPLGWMLTTRVFGAYPARVTEAIVLAFLAGFTIHLVARRFNKRGYGFDPPIRLLAPALLFGTVALASCAVVYHTAQAWHDHPSLYFQRFVDFLARSYHDSLGHVDPTEASGRFSYFVAAALLIEGVALFLVAFVFARDAVYRQRLTAMVIAGAAGAGALSFVALAMTAVGEAGISATWRELLAMRWSMFTPKINTAASLFVLTAPLAFGAAAAATGDKGRAGWIAAGSLIVAALWINGTRAALIAAIIVLVGVFAWLASRRVTRQVVPRWAIVGVVVLTLGLAATTYQRLSESMAVNYALSTRRMFTQTAVNMFASQPVFGVGIGQYYLLSERFAPEELFAVSSLFRRAQAHNAFLQVAAELGIVGLITFVWMVGAALWIIASGLRKHPHDAVLLGAAGGITAFLLTTASSGHPLLLEVTAYPFWIVLGLTAGWAFHGSTFAEVPPVRSHARSRGWSIVAIAAVVLCATVPVRVEREMERINFAEITYGTHGGWRKGGRDRTHVWTSDRATLFLPPNATEVEIPLRALFARYTGPVTVEMSVGGHIIDRVTLTDSKWRPVTLSLPAASRRYLQLDFRVSPTWSSPDAPPWKPDSKDMGVMVGEPVIP